MKKIYGIIIILLIVVAVIAGFLYIYVNLNITPSENKEAEKTGLLGLFPFGQKPVPSSEPVIKTTISSSTEAVPVSKANVPSLRQLSLVPIAGVIAVNQATSSTLIRYIERGTGHMYDQKTDSLTQIRISNKTIPKVYTAFWGNKGDSLLLRFLDDNDNIRTYSAELFTPKTGIIDPQTKDISGFFLPATIRDIALAPSRSRMFYITADNEGSTGVITTLKGERPVTIFNSPFREWQIDWPKENLITLTTKPSGLYSGITYSVNTETKKRDKILDRIFGLTIKGNGDGTLFFYSSTDSVRNTLSLNLYRLNTGTRSELLIRTLPEKCVWSEKNKAVAYCAAPLSLPKALYPDDWYQGRVGFSDVLWKFDATTETLTRIADLQPLTNQNIDAISLTLSPNDEYLLFTNKNDLTLWGLKLQ